MRAISLTHTDVRFGRVHALRGASLRLQAGEVVMLAGPNGAGKSTLMQVLLGLVRPERSELRVDGELRSVDHDFKAKLGYLPEAVAFAESLTARQVLRFFASARGVSANRVDEVLDEVGLSDAARRAVRGYSRGMRQRLGLGVAILGRPALLVLDEPTGGLDQEGLGVLWSVLRRWRAEGGMVLLSSHDLTLLERRVDRISVLRDGRVLVTRTPDDLRRSTKLPTRIRLRLKEDAEASAHERIRAAFGNDAEIHREDDSWHIVLPRDTWTRLLRAGGTLSEHVQEARVEEPGLDVVYEQLLRSEPCDGSRER